MKLILLTIAFDLIENKSEVLNGIRGSTDNFNPAFGVKFIKGKQKYQKEKAKNKNLGF